LNGKMWARVLLTAVDREIILALLTFRGLPARGNKVIYQDED
jgi:hypothetical protein